MFVIPATAENDFFGCLSPKDLFRFARTDREAHSAVISYTRRAFQLQPLLSRYFTDPEIVYFRYWQWRTGMCISGSTALQFFNRSFYSNSDLDIYVEHRHCKPVALWLKVIGYTFQQRNTSQSQMLETALEETLHPDIDINNLSQGFFESTSMGYFGRGVANVYNFYKTNPDRKIQLITSYFAPLEIVLNFHSTCVMNLITHEKAYSLYPYATFEEGRSLVISTEGSRQESARSKYAERGWTMVRTAQDEDIRNPRSDFAPNRRRHIGDSRCWTIPILPTFDELDPTEDLMATNTWKLKYDPVVEPEDPGDPLNVNTIQTGRVEPVLKFMILRLENLRYSYLVVDKSVQDFLTPALFQSSEGGTRFYDEDIKKLLQRARDRQHYFIGQARSKAP